MGDMTKSKAESIMGTTVKVAQVSESSFMASSRVNPGEVDLGGAECSIVEHGKSEEEALEALIRLMYKTRSGIVLERASYRCERCGGLEPLEVHHKVFRSHGRSDALSNLQALCNTCHAKIHEGR